MYKAFFVDLETIHTSEGVLRVFEKVIGRAEARAVVERSKTDEVKRLLSTNTDEALANGCFGLPYISATNAEGKKESYWGFDHLGQVLDHLGLQGDEAGTSRDRGWRAML
ncbi:hypothetical protein MMC06_001383 [Schaereria dolodes]|nr:hypothetical protein [Schaereria dolodes]